MSDESDLMDSKVVVERRERADYELPEGLLNAHAAHEAARSMKVLAPEDVDGPRHPADAAEAVADLLVAGEPVDVLAAAEEVAENMRQVELRGNAWGIAREVREATGRRLASAVRVNAEEIVAEHLRPAFALLLAEARSLSETLRSAGVDPLGPARPVWEDPPPDEVRAAVRRLSELADQRALIADAYGRVLRVAGLRAEQDTGGLFSYVERPQALVGGWEPGRPLPRPEPPSREPLPVLVWLVRDVWTAGPWLPVPRQRDEAFDALFGERVRDLKNRHEAARAIASTR